MHGVHDQLSPPAPHAVRLMLVAWSSRNYIEHTGKQTFVAVGAYADLSSTDGHFCMRHHMTSALVRVCQLYLSLRLRLRFPLGFDKNEIIDLKAETCAPHEVCREIYDTRRILAGDDAP